MKLPSIS